MRSIADASRYLIPALWAIWIVGWIAAAGFVKRTRWREPWREGAANRIPVLLGAALFVVPERLPLAIGQHILPVGPGPALWGLLLVLVGLLLAAWARLYIGRNWSGNVTVKEGHTLVCSGPYRLVRHPIYSGILLALLGTALAIGEARGFIGTGLILIGFLIKLRVEEGRMREAFPAAYDDYCRHTARLVPGLY